MKLVLASKNQHKLIELRTILGQLGLEVVLESDVGVDVDVEETGTTFEENSLLKARAVMEASGMAAIADDSGLEVDALNGEPGVYSARFGGLDTDEARTALLLQRLQNVPDDQRTARFVSVVTCVLPNGTVVAARGTCEGVINHAPAGENGFGYDPLFFSNDLNKCMGLATAEEKNSVSHRFRAIEQLKKKLL